MDWNGKHIGISRTDSIGDVMLTLPICTWLKQHYPTCKITFFCKTYTAVLVESYQSVDAVFCVDEFLNWAQNKQVQHIQSMNLDAFVHVFPNKTLAKTIHKAKVRYRIGTSHRLFHWLTCNVRPNFTRKKSDLHEAQLNFKLLEFFGCKAIPSIEELIAYTSNFQPQTVDLPESIKKQLSTNYFILHPKSQGSALEWPIEKYRFLANQLIEKGYQVVFTGTEKEGLLYRNSLPSHPACIDSSGKLSMIELCMLIRNASGLVACSTGPLHIAAFSGIKAVGLFSSRRPIHPGRWKPIGKQAVAVVYDENCPTCLEGKSCSCIESISPENILALLIETPA